MSVEAEPTRPATGFRWPAWLNAAFLLVVGAILISALSFQIRLGTEVVIGAFLVPVIALTGNALVSQRESCIAAGMKEYLAKPFPGRRFPCPD